MGTGSGGVYGFSVVPRIWNQLTAKCAVLGVEEVLDAPDPWKALAFLESTWEPLTTGGTADA